MLWCRPGEEVPGAPMQARCKAHGSGAGQAQGSRKVPEIPVLGGLLQLKVLCPAGQGQVKGSIKQCSRRLRVRNIRINIPNQIWNPRSLSNPQPSGPLACLRRDGLRDLASPPVEP